jgi:hypothetical protein
MQPSPSAFGGAGETVVGKPFGAYLTFGKPERLGAACPPETQAEVGMTESRRVGPSMQLQISHGHRDRSPSTVPSPPCLVRWIFATGGVTRAAHIRDTSGRPRKIAQPAAYR